MVIIQGKSMCALDSVVKDCVSFVMLFASFKRAYGISYLVDAEKRISMRFSGRHVAFKYPFGAARSEFWLILRHAKFFLQKNFVSRHLKNKCASSKKLPKKSHSMLGFLQFF